MRFSTQTTSKGSTFNKNLIGMFSRHLWKKVRKKNKHVNTVVNSIQTLPLLVGKSISNPHNISPPVDFYRINLSTSSCADQNVVSDGISHSYDCTSSYPTYSVVFQGSRLRIGINLSPCYLKALSTPLNGL